MKKLVARLALAAMAAMWVYGEEWRESTLYITRFGPAEPAVETRASLQREEVRKPREEGSRRSTGQEDEATALEEGIVRAGSTATLLRGRERSTRGEQWELEYKERAMTTVRRQAREQKRESKAAPSMTASAAIDKFVDTDKDGYNDRTHCDDL